MPRQTSIADTLQSNLDAIKADVKASAEALDEAILTDPELSHKQRMVLIHLQSTVRKQHLTLELLTICIDSVDKRVDNVMEHITAR